MRRATVIILIILFVLAAAAIYYYLFYRTAPPGGANPGTVSETPPAPVSIPTVTVGQGGAVGQAQKFGIVAQNPVADYFVDTENNVFFVQPDGQVAEVISGVVSVLSSSQISNLIAAAFSSDGKKMLVSFGDVASPQSSVLDIATKSWQPLSAGFLSAVWSPNDYRIAYLSKKGAVSTLWTLDVSNAKTKPTPLLTLHIEDPELFWPSQNQIIVSDRGNSYFSGSAWSFDIKKKTLAPLITSDFGLESMWSGAANEGLVFSTAISRRGGNLSLMDTAGNKLNDLTFLTLPNKCLFHPEGGAASAATTTRPKAAAKNFLYCAVPRDKQKLSVAALPDDYNMKSLFTSDDIYKTDLGDGSISVVFGNQNVSVDATNLKIFNGALFFVNRLDQKLYVVTAIQN